MPFVTTTIKRIEVHKAGEDEAEWRLTIRGKAAAGGSGDYERGWHADTVSNNSSHSIDTSWLFILNQGEKININIFGYEEDGGLFDPSDTLPGVGVAVDPTTAGNDFRITGDNGEFAYTIVMSFVVINL
jgi:hypothetical protein